MQTRDRGKQSEQGQEKRDQADKLRTAIWAAVGIVYKAYYHSNKNKNIGCTILTKFAI